MHRSRFCIIDIHVYLKQKSTTVNVACSIRGNDFSKYTVCSKLQRTFPLLSREHTYCHRWFHEDNYGPRIASSCPEESYRVGCVWMRSRNPAEDAYGYWGCRAMRKIYIIALLNKTLQRGLVTPTPTLVFERLIIRTKISVSWQYNVSPSYSFYLLLNSTYSLSYSVSDGALSPQ